MNMRKLPTNEAERALLKCFHLFLFPGIIQVPFKALSPLMGPIKKGYLKDNLYLVDIV
jgi:hypothetical protein